MKEVMKKENALDDINVMCLSNLYVSYVREMNSVISHSFILKGIKTKLNSKTQAGLYV